jgi:hypothetical protein
MIRNDDSSNSWTQLPLSGVPSGYAFYCPTIDQANSRMLFDQSYSENDLLEMNALFIRMTKNGEVQVEAERKWKVDKKSLFGETGPNVKLAYSSEKRQVFGGWGPGVINDSEIYLPYNVSGETHHGNLVIGDEGPFNNGVFHSTDSGATWQMERISADCDGGEPKM